MVLLWVVNYRNIPASSRRVNLYRMPITTTYVESTPTCGMNQGDIVVRTALMEGFRRLRANPWELDYVFAFLPNDELTAETYGLKSLKRAKDWFLNTEIQVSMDTRMDQSKLPMVSITMMDDAEDQSSLGDTHYDTQEPLSSDPNTGVSLKSLFFRESYRLGVYVQGEPETCLNLYAVVKYVLLRYKKELLEARGFERTQIQGSQFGHIEDIGRENLFGRQITVTGYVKAYWPTGKEAKITEVVGTIDILDGPRSPSLPEDPPWIMEGDKDVTFG